MGLFDDWKKKVSDKIAERAADIAAERSKQAAKDFAKKSVETAKGFGKKLEEELFGPSPEGSLEAPDERSADDEGSRASREKEAGDTLRAGAARNEERKKAEALEAKARVEKAARLEEEVDAELAALKKRLKKD